MKKEIAAYVGRCDVYSRVKADHLKPGGPLQPLSIPGWKWEEISMNFIIGLPQTQQGHDSIWVIVDHLTKSAHFVPDNTKYHAGKYTELYVSLVMRLQGVPRTIISDWGP